jgi:hypothetical protein
MTGGAEQVVFRVVEENKPPQQEEGFNPDLILGHTYTVLQNSREKLAALSEKERGTEPILPEESYEKRETLLFNIDYLLNPNNGVRRFVYETLKGYPERALVLRLASSYRLSEAVEIRKASFFLGSDLKTRTINYSRVGALDLLLDERPEVVRTLPHYIRTLASLVFHTFRGKGEEGHEPYRISEIVAHLTSLIEGSSKEEILESSAWGLHAMRHVHYSDSLKHVLHLKERSCGTTQ